MAARNRTDAIGHANQGKAKGKADACKADIAPGKHRRPTAKENKSESADKLGQLLLHWKPPAELVEQR